MPITTAQFEQMRARVAPIKVSENEMPTFVKESDLHDQIAAELVRRRYYFVHSRFDRPTTTQKGVVDFIIAAPDGTTYWCEVKRKDGKLTPEQNITRHVLLGLNHRHFVVRSMSEFLEKIK